MTKVKGKMIFKLSPEHREQLMNQETLNIEFDIELGAYQEVCFNDFEASIILNPDDENQNIKMEDYEAKEDWVDHC